MHRNAHRSSLWAVSLSAEPCCRSWWKPKESTILLPRRTTSSASGRATFWRSACFWSDESLSLSYLGVTSGFLTLLWQILSPQDEWYKAEMNGHEGFVPQNYIEMQTPRWETQPLFKTYTAWKRKSSSNWKSTLCLFFHRYRTFF